MPIKPEKFRKCSLLRELQRSFVNSVLWPRRWPGWLMGRPGLRRQPCFDTRFVVDPGQAPELFLTSLASAAKLNDRTFLTGKQG